jgi:hypothetical protein
MVLITFFSAVSAAEVRIIMNEDSGLWNGHSVLSAGTEKNHVTKHVCGAVVRTFCYESRRAEVALSGVDRTKGTRLLSCLLYVICLVVIS